MLNFRTMASDRVRFISNSGDHTKITYTPRWNDSGKIELVATGQIDTYSEIQSHRDSVDINVLLAKYAQTGDLSILDKVRTQFMDVSGMPTSMAGFYNFVEDGRRMFESLPVDERAKYNNSFEQFIFTATKPAVTVPSESVPVIESEVK